MTVLVIEDDVVIRDELVKFLTINSYEVATICSFHHVLEQIEAISPHLILLDVNLPENDGYSICRKLRESSEIPIIILTSRDTELDELLSMNIGADDFVRKPFQPQILLARIERLLKRIYSSKANDVLEACGIRLDLTKGTVSHQDHTETLTKNELGILNYLLSHRGELVSRDDLMLFLWDSSSFVDDNTLSVNITRLRKKLELIGVTDAIKTRRGLGYVLL